MINIGAKCGLLIIGLIVLAGISCTKEVNSDSTNFNIITKESYQNLNTTLIFEEDFNDFSEWIIDTGYQDVIGPFFSVIGSGKRCFLENGMIVLNAYHQPFRYDSVQNEYLNTLNRTIIRTNFGNVDMASQYLLELDLIGFNSLKSYEGRHGSHDSSFKDGGTEIIIVLNQIEYSVFGEHSTRDISTQNANEQFKSDCRTEFVNTKVSLILRPSSVNNQALIDNNLIELCTSQQNSKSTENYIEIELNPLMEGDYGVGASNRTTSTADHCSIDHIRLSAIN